MSTAFHANDTTPKLDGVASNNELRVSVKTADLPVHCPSSGSTLWNSHPRVYIPLGDGNDKDVCPYCGTEYVLEG